LNESHHFLLKLSCKSVCGNLDAVSARFAVCFFQTIFAVEQGVIVAVIVVTLFIFTLLRCTKTRVQSNLSSKFAKTPIPEVGLQNFRVCRQTWILSNSLTTG